MSDAPKDKVVGVVRDYFRKIGVAAVEVTETGFRVGDTLRFRGHTTDFTHAVRSLQVDHKEVTEAGPGDLVGINVPERVRENDKVYLVEE